MARFQILQVPTGMLIVIAGPLTASDMGRLEHACSPALTTRALRLEIDLRAVTVMDRTAGAILHKMADRGAVLSGERHMIPTETVTTRW